MVTRSKAQVEAELRRTIREIKLCDVGSETQMRKFKRRDDLLDELLTIMGAHDDDCHCVPCDERLGRFRHLGECLSPEDVAHEGW